MKFEYLIDIKTVEQLKREYKRFVFVCHPDCGGTNEAMKVLRNEYDILIKKVGNIHESTKDDATNPTYETHVNPDDLDDGFTIIIDALANLMIRGIITVELCGSWIWISGNTKEYKDLLKNIGCFWSGNKKMWYWHNPNQKRPFHKKAKTIEEIRGMYGSKKINAKSNSIALESGDK